MDNSLRWIGNITLEIFLTDVVTSLTSSVITFDQQVACHNDGKTEFLKLSDLLWGTLRHKCCEKFTTFF